MSKNLEIKVKLTSHKEVKEILKKNKIPFQELLLQKDIYYRVNKITNPGCGYRSHERCLDLIRRVPDPRRSLSRNQGRGAPPAMRSRMPERPGRLFHPSPPGSRPKR